MSPENKVKKTSSFLSVFFFLMNLVQKMRSFLRRRTGKKKDLFVWRNAEKLMISVQQLIGSSLRAVAAATSKNCIHHIRVHDRHLQCHSNRAVENPTVPGAGDTVTQTITVVWTRSPNRPGIEHVADEFKDICFVDSIFYDQYWFVF